jgi:hypothetical protein
LSAVQHTPGPVLSMSMFASRADYLEALESLRNIPRPDQRGPMRTIASVRHDASGTYPTFDCGHTGNWTYCPTTKAGDRGHCFACSEGEWASYRERYAEAQRAAIAKATGSAAS